MSFPTKVNYEALNLICHCADCLFIKTSSASLRGNVITGLD